MSLIRCAFRIIAGRYPKDPADKKRLDKEETDEDCSVLIDRPGATAEVPSFQSGGMNTGSAVESGRSNENYDEGMKLAQ